MVPLPGGGYAEIEWRKLSLKQRAALLDLVGQIRDPYRQAHDLRHPQYPAWMRLGHGIVTYRALAKRGLLPETGHIPTERGQVLGVWAVENGAEA
jgi:hypothetical protein